MKSILVNGMVDCVTTLQLEARMVVGSEAYDSQARATSPDAAIQEVDREAIARLRHEHRELRRTLMLTCR